MIETYLLIRQRIRMYSNPLNLDPLHRPILPIDLHRLQFIQRRIHPLNDPPEHRILPIQMRRAPIRDEELTPIRAGPPIRHAYDPARIMAQRGPNLVLEVRVPDRCPAFAFAARVPRLDHEAGDRAVEGDAVVVG